MSDYGHEQTDIELKELEKRLAKEYSKATKDLEKKFEGYMKDFARKDEQMKKLVDSGKLKEEDYENWRRNQLIIGERWKDMYDTLAKDLANVDQIAAGMINETLPSVYALNMNYGTYEVESGCRIDTGFNLYSRETVENMMKNEPNIIPKLTEGQKKKIEKDELWNRKKLVSAVTQGILQGESIPKIAERLGSVAKMDFNASRRNARTYTTAAENKGRMDSYERADKMGIQVKKKWIATLDDRTRVEHRHLDGMVVPYQDLFEMDGYEIMFPGDPDAEPEMIYNCRCTLVAEIPGIQYQDERYDEKLGGMSYEEWKHAKDKPGKEGIVEEKKEETRTVKPEIPENVRKEIDRFEDKFRNAKKENYMAIDKDGNVIFESSGKERKVTVPKYVDEQMEGGYSIHNHPIDATFSVADISNYEKYGEHGIITDTNGYESILYNMNPVAVYKEVEKVDTDEEFERLMPFSSAAYKAFTEIDNDITDRRREYSKELLQTEPDSVTRAKLLNEWMKENDPEVRKREWLEENAEKYSFIFERRNLDDTTAAETVEQKKEENPVVQGKDISLTWERRKDEFEFRIEDIINAQGFDGLPKVVSKDEFDKAVKESGFIAQRTYSAVDKETLATYQDSLYYGKWYVDCSVGGSAHGKGMYSAASYDGELNDEIKQEMKDYIGQNENYTSSDAPYIIETFTVDPSANFLEIPPKIDDEDYVGQLFSNHIIKNLGEKYGVEEKANEWVSLNEEKLKNEILFMQGKITEKEYSDIAGEINDKVNKLRFSAELNDVVAEYMKKGYRVPDMGEKAALMGYDGLHTHYGTCKNDTIILNRTKLIFKEGK